MIDKKELTKNIVPLPGQVKVEVILPKEYVTESGIIIPDSTRSNKFSEIKHYDVIVLEKADDVPDSIKVGEKYKTDVFSGVMVPTKEDNYVKVINYDMLIGTSVKEAKKYKPKSERILVKVTSLTDKTESGIIAPGENKKSLFEHDTLGGEIISVSEDLEGDYKPGDKIRWESHAGSEVPFENDKNTYRSILKYAVICKLR